MKTMNFRSQLPFLIALSWNHLCPGLHAAAKIAILRVLRKIVSLTIFCGARDFSLFFVMLIITKPERVADLKKFAKIAKNL